MFGKNPVMGRIAGDGSLLRVTRNPEGLVFKTIQGEGPFAGRVASFIRLHGCNLRCTFCDTEFSKESDPWVDIRTLVSEAIAHQSDVAVITGGEPMLQNILPLAKALTELACVAQIETAGTLWIEGIENVSHVVVSPKTAKIDPRAAKHAAAFKYVVSTKQQFTDDGIPIAATQPGQERAVPLAGPMGGVPIYYSPMDEYDAAQNAANAALAGQLALKHNRRLTVQMHKIAGLA